MKSLLVDAFGGALRALNVVPRWGCVPRIKEHSTAVHSYWVTIYAGLIADHIGCNTGDKLRILEYALLHDAPEAATGDILGPVKRSTVDESKMEDYVSRSFAQWGIGHMLPVREPRWIRDVVKAADIIDDMMTLSEEIALGNRRAESLYMLLEGRLRTALKRIDCEVLFSQISNSCAVVRHSPLTIVQEDSDLDRAEMVAAG